MPSTTRVGARRRPRRILPLAAAIVAIVVVAVTRPSAQQPPTPSVSQFPRIPLTTGRSTVLATRFDIVRIAVTNPAIADAVVVQPREILIDGKAPGTVSLIIWGGAEE